MSSDAITSSIGSATPSIDLNSIESLGVLTLPDHVDISFNAQLQPRTTVKVGQLEVSGMAYGWNANNPLAVWESENPFSKAYQYPYAVEVDNVFNIRKAVMKVDLFTANEVQIVSSSGRPIDAADIKDYDLGAIINNPTMDNMQWQVKTSSTNIVGQGIEDLFDNFFAKYGAIFQQVAIFGVVIVIAITALVVVIRRRSSRSSTAAPVTTQATTP
jgi:hypothetical protein